MSFAQDTAVPVTQTRGEIERMLSSIGATSTAFMNRPTEAMIAFEFDGKLVRFVLPLPPLSEYALTPKKMNRSVAQQLAAREQDHKARWRALALGIKAKLVFVESGIRTFEQEFLADFVMPNGKTLGDNAIPQIRDAVASKKMPLLGWS